MTGRWMPPDTHLAGLFFPLCRLLTHRFTPIRFTMESREGGSYVKHWVTLLAQLLLILVGFWVGIRHFENASRTLLLFRGCTIPTGPTGVKKQMSLRLLIP